MAAFAARVHALAADPFSYRFVLVDASRTMAKKDSTKDVTNGRGGYKVEACMRYDEACATVLGMARLSAETSAPMDVRVVSVRGLDAAQQPLTVGKVPDDGGRAVASVAAALAAEPAGPKCVCRALVEVAAQVRWIEDILRITDKQALVVLVTDGEATDGSVADALRPLEGLPVHVLVRLCSEDRQVLRYWRGLAADVDVNLTVVASLRAEAQRVHAVNRSVHTATPTPGPMRDTPTHPHRTAPPSPPSPSPVARAVDGDCWLPDREGG
jgi:hypothetical protein